MPKWLNQYANNYHQWQTASLNGQTEFYRPLGLVETAFDADGQYFEGRADISALLELKISTSLSKERLRERIVLAYTALRLHHVLLMARCIERPRGLKVNDTPSTRLFSVKQPSSEEDAIVDASRDIVFTDDFQHKLDITEFYRHTQNSSRVVDASESLVRCFVLPVNPDSRGMADLRLFLVMGHQITDGMTTHTWLSHLVKLLNLPPVDLRRTIVEAISPQALQNRLPVPQEDLYPPISGPSAKQRWFWLLTIVLRHVRKPSPAAFPNPLHRQKPREQATPLSPTYNKLLDYSRVPPLNTFTSSVHIRQTQTKRLHRLCREVSASIGAGCFVLVAMVMMALHEARYPDIPDVERLPFLGSFPLNPRQFFNHHAPPDSMMLAFSDGVVLPFLPSSLPFEGRFRLLARQAHRQLSVYQKKPKTQIDDMMAHMSTKGAGRIIALNYIQAAERATSRLPPQLRRQEMDFNPQGKLGVKPNPTGATCGISSVGRSAWKMGEYDVDTELPEGKDTFVADFRRLQQNVRAREGEFLVGIGGDDNGIGSNVSYDGNAIDEESVVEWKRRMETILDEDIVSSKL